MKAKKLLAVLLAVCLCLSALPMAMFTVVAEYASADYLTVECNTTIGATSKTETNSNGNYGVANETSNISTINGSVAVYSIEFGEGTYSSMQIHYSGRSTDNRCPASANANVYLGNYWTDPANCTLLGNVKLPPYTRSSDASWENRNLSTIVSFAGLTGTQTVSVEYIGEEGYSAVANARQMYFYKDAITDLTSYVDADNAKVVSGSRSKTGADGGEGPAKLFAGLGNKMGIDFDAGEVPTLTYTTTVPTTVYAYTYMTANDSSERDPKSWNFYGSSDGKDYTLIDAVTDFTPASETRCCWVDTMFKVDSPAEYSYYKLEITAFRNITSGYCQFDEWRTYGSVYSGTAAIEETEALIAAIASAEPLTDAYFEAVDAARDAYAALSVENQAYVSNIADLTAPAAIAQAKADGKDYTYIYNTIEAIKAVMPITYKSKTSLDAIEAIYTDAVSALGETDVQTYVVNYADAKNAKATYAQVIADFGVTFTLNRDRMTATNQPWLALQTDDEWNTTLRAMEDTVKYFYSERMINIGVVSGRTGSTENHDSVFGAQLDNKFVDIGKNGANDNCWNPWNQDGRYWSYLIVPFSGMAFDVGGYMVVNDNHKQAPLGEEFDLTADGRTYQVMWDKTISHVTTPRENGKSITVDSVATYPGSGDYAAAIGNVFRYMYANYAQTNKWAGKTLGYPTANAGLAGENTYYQNFQSDDGSAVLLSTGDILSSVALATDAEGYEAQLKTAAGNGYVITGDMAAVIDAKGGATAFFSGTGDLNATESTAERLVFAKGVLTADGFESTLSEEELQTMAAPVVALIDAIGEVTTLGPSGNKLSAIEAAEAAYADLLVDARVYVTNYATLTAARAAYDALVDALEVYDNAKYVTPISGREHDSEGYEKLFDGDYTNKLYMNNDSYVDTVFSTATPVKISGYILSTGGDTAVADNTPGGRNPVSWILYGSNDEGQSWTEIINSALSLPTTNNTPVTMYLDSATEGYTYFKAAFTMSSVGKMQLGELALITTKEANYDAVLAALAKVPADLSIYTDASAGALTAAVDAVEYNLAPAAQSTVDDYASAIESAVTGLEIKDADYSRVNTAKAKAAALTQANYTPESWLVLEEAVNAVVEGKKITEQSVVDGYADAIEAALSDLQLIADIADKVEMSVQISTGMVTANAEDGKYDITWNGSIVPGANTSVGEINESGIIFKAYGVYYATGSEVLDDYKNASAEQIRQIVFEQGTDIEVYTQFGFRLKGVLENRVRAAMFYLEYELDGQSYILLSTTDQVVAVIAE